MQFDLLFSLLFVDSRLRSCFFFHPNSYIVNMAYAEAARAALIKYRVLKFFTLPNANANTPYSLMADTREKTGAYSCKQ